MDAINDKNVLPFRVDYIKTMDAEPDMDDKQVWDIDREKAFMAPKRISLVTKYSLQGTTQGNGLTGGVPPVRFSM